MSASFDPTKPFKTRSGCTLEQFGNFDGAHPFIGRVNGCTRLWHLDGRNSYSSSLDLINDPEITEPPCAGDTVLIRAEFSRFVQDTDTFAIRLGPTSWFSGFSTDSIVSVEKRAPRPAPPKPFVPGDTVRHLTGTRDLKIVAVGDDLAWCRAERHTCGVIYPLKELKHAEAVS